MFYVTFEEGFVIFINNPVSAKFSVNAISTVTGIAPFTAQCSETHNAEFKNGG